MLLKRLGLSPTDPRLRILASSASLNPKKKESLEFLTDFFGCEWTPEQIVTGDEQPIVTSSKLQLNAETFVNFMKGYASSSDEQKGEACNSLAKTLYPASTGASQELELCSALEHLEDDLSNTMLQICLDVDRTRAVSLSNFARGIFSNNETNDDLFYATKGLLIALGICSGLDRAQAIPSFRFHWFFRNIEGLWACTFPGCQCEDQYLDGRRPAGKLFDQNRILCANEDEKHRVLEMLYCEQCGTLFFGGSRLKSEEGEFELLGTDPEIEGLPDKQTGLFVDRRTFREFALFWPTGESCLNADAKHWQQTRLNDGGSTRARWAPKFFNVLSGRVTDAATGELVPSGHAVPGFLFTILLDDPEDENNFSALPSRCPNCAADYSRRLYSKSPVRGFRTGFSKVSQILSKELFYCLPEGEQRKLVVFSDSREDAASISNGIERSHYFDLVREAMYDELVHASLGLGFLLEDLEKKGAPVRPEAIRVADADHESIEIILNAVRNSKKTIPEGLDEEDRALFEDRRNESGQLLDEIRLRHSRRLVPLKILFEAQDERNTNTGPGLLIERLAKLGINPAGNDVLYQDFYFDGRWHDWKVSSIILMLLVLGIKIFPLLPTKKKRRSDQKCKLK